jgi:hypothetical protein
MSKRSEGVPPSGGSAGGVFSRAFWGSQNTTKFEFTSAGGLLNMFEEVYGPIVVGDPNDERTVVPMQQPG